jgi:Ca2+-binding EF-hand superfamily protein
MALGSQACNITVDLPKTLPSLVVAGSPPPPPSPKPTVYGNACDAQLKIYDTDGDGTLNISEMNELVNPPFNDCPACGVGRPPQDPAEAIKPYDRNHDGRLQRDEFCAYLDGVPVPSPSPVVSATPTPIVIIEPTMPPPSIAPIATPTPVPTPKPNLGSYTATPAPFDDLDTDKDGKISWDEEVAYQTKAGPLPAGAKDKIYDLFRQADTNQNGTLERAEYDFARS